MKSIRLIAYEVATFFFFTKSLLFLIVSVSSTYASFLFLLHWGHLLESLSLLFSVHLRMIVTLKCSRL